MACLVMKFGGTSVADIERIGIAARHIKREVDAGHSVVAIVSAMSGVTNELVNLVRKIAPSVCDEYEYDTVVSSGEQVVSGILSLALKNIGILSRSWQGWQIPITTNEVHGSAFIKEIDGRRLCDSLAQGMVCVVSGFQGVTSSGNITTLGRGGSDTSAVAVAVAIQADRCDVYTDVDGIYTTDPRIVARAQRLDRVLYEEMLEMSSLGARVLHTRSVEMAMNYKVPILVRSSFITPEDLAPAFASSDLSIGTFVCDEDHIMERRTVSGIAYSKDEARITLIGARGESDALVRILESLATSRINVDMIVQSISGDRGRINLTFTVPAIDFDRATHVIEGIRADIGYTEMACATDVAKISIIGVGMQNHSGVAVEMFRTLANLGIAVQAITTSEIKISVLIDAAYVELAMRALHSTYGLDAN